MVEGGLLPKVVPDPHPIPLFSVPCKMKSLTLSLRMPHHRSSKKGQVGMNQDNHCSLRSLCQVLDNSTRRLHNTQSYPVKNERVSFSFLTFWESAIPTSSRSQTPSEHCSILSFTENTN